MIRLLKKNKTIQSLSISKKNDDSYEFIHLLLSYKKGKIDIRHQASYHETELAAVIPHLDKKKPLVIGLLGKGTNLKIVKKESEEIDLAANIPGYNEDAFMARWYAWKDKYFVIGVARLAEIKEITDVFTGSGFNIPLIGISDVNCFLFDEYNVFSERTVSTGFFTLDFNEEKIERLQESAVKSYATREEIGKNLLKNQYLSAFANAIAYFTDELEGSNLQLEEEQQEIIYQKNLFHYFGISMIVFFFSVLLANYFIQGSLNQKLIDKEAELVFNSQILDELNSIEDELTKKNELMSLSGILNPNGATFYLNQMGRNIPDDIELVNLNIFPVNSKIKKEQLIRVNDQTIWVQGKAFSSEDFYTWVDYLSSQNWNKDVEVLDYNNKQEKRYAEFSINIILK